MAELYHYGLRHYSPELGRWISRDPIGEEGGVHLCGFVGNDSVNRHDILGMAEEGRTDKAKCCEVKELWTEFGGGFAMKKAFGATIKARWNVVDPKLCEAAQFLSLDVTIPGLNNAQVQAAYAWLGAPWVPPPPNWPFFVNHIDWGWESLPFDDPLGFAPGKDAAGAYLPTIAVFKGVIRVRDKATKVVVKESEVFTFSFRNYDPAVAPPTPSNAGSKVFNIGG